MKLAVYIRLISFDWLFCVLRRIVNIFQPYNGGNYVVMTPYGILTFSLAALTSLLFFEIQRNGLLRTKGIVNLDTGHHFTFHLTDTSQQDLYCIRMGYCVIKDIVIFGSIRILRIFCLSILYVNIFCGSREKKII